MRIGALIVCERRYSFFLQQKEDIGMYQKKKDIGDDVSKCTTGFWDDDKVWALMRISYPNQWLQKLGLSFCCFIPKPIILIQNGTLSNYQVLCLNWSLYVCGKWKRTINWNWR